MRAPGGRRCDRVNDVVVFGATACGVMAAVAARRAGAEAVLVEPGEHGGGRGDPIIAGGWLR